MGETNYMKRIGGHISAKSGLSVVVTAARALGYNAVQVMLGQGS